MKLLDVIDDASNDARQKDEWLAREQQTKSIRSSVMAPDDVARINHCSTAKEIWEIIEDFYGSETSNLKLELINEITQAKFENLEGVADGINAMRTERTERMRLQNIGWNLNYTVIMSVIVKALPEELEDFTMSFRMLNSQTTCQKNKFWNV